MTLQTQNYQSGTYNNQSNIANIGIRSFDDKNHSLGGVADERLTQIWRTGVELFEKLRLVEEVCS